MRLAVIGTALAAVLASLTLHAQPYPNRPIAMIVPFPPGGIADLTGRPFAASLTRVLGQSIVVENKAGAGGAVGHPQVERIICGHQHRSIQFRVAHTVASTCPAPCHQVALDLRPHGPSAFMMEPPGYQLHCWIDGAGLVTHTGVIGEFGGPYPFFEAGGRLID